MLKIQLNDDFYLKTATVFGIVSELPDTRLCFKLNNDLQLKLCRGENDKVYCYKGVDFRFTEFSFTHRLNEVRWNLTSNKSQGAKNKSDKPSLFVENSIPLVPDLKLFDFFLWYEETAIKELDLHINSTLKSLPYIRTFQKIDIKSSKHINNLLLED